MKHLHRMFLVSGFLIALLGAIFLISGCGGSSTEPKEIVKIDGTPITRSEFMSSLENGDGLKEGPRTGRIVLEQLIARRLIEKDAKEKSITISDEEMNFAMDGLKKEVQGQGQTLDQFIKQIGLSEARLKDQLRFNLLLQRLVVSNSAAEQYYNEHPAEFDSQESISYYQMFLPTKEEALAIRKEAVAGKTKFETLARSKSVNSGPAPVPPGGILINLGKGNMPEAPEVEKVLFSLKPGEISQPVARETMIPGPTRKSAPTKVTLWSLFQVVTHTPAQKMTYDKAKLEVRRRVFSREAAMGNVASYVNGLKAKTRLEVIDPDYMAIGEEFKELAKTDAAKTPKPVAPDQQAPAAPAGK